MLTGPIKYALLKKLHRNFLGGKHKVLSRDIGGKFETKAIWFQNNNDLHDFCKLIVDAGSDSNEISGIRFYFCAYDVSQIDNEDVPGGKVPHDPRYVDQLTLAFVTTKKVGDKHIDIEDDDKKMFFSPFNNGKLCPPETDCEI